MNSQEIAVFRKVSFFSGLTDELLKLVADVSEEKSYLKNNIIFMEGDRAEAFYFIKSGQVKISKVSESGREVIVHILGAGDYFAEATLFQKDATYPATAEVMDDAVIGIIKSEKLERLVLQNSELALELIGALTKKLVTIQNRIRHLGTNDTAQRTIQVLLALAEGHGRETSAGIELCVNITRQDLAAFVGTTRETISRMLSKFSQAELIDASGKSIVITDFEGLKEWIE